MRELRALGATILATAVGVAAFGLIDIYAIPLAWWRDSGAPGWFTQQLGFDYQGLSGLPENFLYNTGNERAAAAARLDVPLAARDARTCSWSRCSLAAAWRLRLRGGRSRSGSARSRSLRGLLWTHSRSSELALALRPARLRPGATAVAALARRRRRCSSSASACVFVKAYPHIGPRTTFTPHELECQRAECRSRARSASAELRLPGQCRRRGPAARGRSRGRPPGRERALGREHREPLAEPPGRRRDGAPAPPGLRPRQRRLDGGAYRRDDQGRRVDLHRARRRHGAPGRPLFIAWSLALLWRVLPCAPGSAPRSPRCSRSGCRRT